jgi:uncharacterized membrane protein YbhN (UPF0104 family)
MSAHARLAFGVALLLTVLAAVQWSIGWPQLLAPWRSLDPLALALAAVLTLLSYLARTLRLYDYFLPATAGGLGACLKLTLLHNLLNNLLPMRSGELSFPLLLHRYFAVPLPRSLAALLWFRLMDLYALGLIALMAIGERWLPVGWLAPLAVAWLALPWLLLPVQERLLPRVAGRLPERWRARLAQGQLVGHGPSAAVGLTGKGQPTSSRSAASSDSRSKGLASTASAPASRLPRKLSSE